MTGRADNWTLYLPIGTIESERLLFLLEFTSKQYVDVFFINVLPFRQDNEDFKNFDKNASAESSKRSINSTDKSYPSEDKSHSGGSIRNVSHSMGGRTISPDKAMAFDKRTSIDPPDPRKRESMPDQLSPSKAVICKFIQLFMPTLRVNDQVYLQNQQSICMTLLDKYGTGSKLGLLTESSRSIQEQINKIETRIDIHVRRLMSFIYLNTTDADAYIKDSESKKVTLNWNSYQLILDALIKELDTFHNRYLCHRTITADSELTLVDVYLVTALNRVYKFLFDPNFAKSWMSNITTWFHKITKRKEFENAFGKFRVCKVNYISLMRDIEAEKDPQDVRLESESVVPRLMDLKSHIREVKAKHDPANVINHIDTTLFKNLVFEGFKGDNFTLWVFSYIQMEEDHRFRKNSSKNDQVSVFFKNFSDAAEKDNLDFLLYMVQYAKCESLGNFPNAKRNFDACKVHFGNYFVTSDIKGFALTQQPDLPKFLKLYEDKDILQVMPVTLDQHLRLEEALKRSGEWTFERVIDEQIF